jgi:magnesium transporter
LYAGPLSFEWHIVRDPQGPELDQLAARYGLHPLHIEDCRHRQQNAKVEENHYLFAVAKPAALKEHGELDITDLDLFLGPDFLITVEEGDCPTLRRSIDQLRAGPAPQRGDQLFYRIIDAIVDTYLPVLDHYDDSIDDISDRVLANPTPADLDRIFETRRNLILLRRVLANTRDMSAHLQRSESPLIGRDMWPYLRDVYDHVARNLDTVETLRDLLNGTLDVYLSAVANRTNQVMKVLTVLGTIALPAIVISGIYGMNVKGLPWIESPWGSAIIGGMMALSTAGLLLLLRWLRWL